MVDGLRACAMLSRVAAEFAAMDRSRRSSNNANERKLSTEDPGRFGPYTTKVISALNSGPFVKA